MNIILIGLAALAVTIVAGPVVLVSAVHRQERAGSLTSQPSGLLALLAARILGLRTTSPAAGQVRS